MILFYSEYCPHCRMLLDTVKRHDANGLVKLACIEHLRAKGKPIPKQINAVPALLLMPTKTLIYGKDVFDYLLLPGSGKLLVGVGVGAAPSASNLDASKNKIDEPAAYCMSFTGGISDGFSMIEDDVHPMDGLGDRSYGWTAIESAAAGGVSVFPDAPFQEETRSKKNLPDLDSFRAQREMELKQSDLNTSQLLPPSFTR